MSRTDTSREAGPILGAHISAAGGLHTAFDRAEDVGCDTMQIFTKNKGAWRAKPLEDEAIAQFRKRASESSVGPVVTHASYLLNLASPDAALREKSSEALRIELERNEALGIPYLVLHPGAHKDTGEAAGLARVNTALNQVLAWTKGFEGKVLLENSAGQGSSVCREFASLARVLKDSAAPERLGVCIDTCHLFAAGYELRTKAGYEETMTQLTDAVGLEAVLCLHLNDSKKELGTRVDRHEHIGQGHIGTGAFRLLLCDRRFCKVPMVFELPPDDDMLRVNLETLRGLAQ